MSHQNQLWASLIGRLRQSQMEESDLLECNAAIQRKILFDLGYDSYAVESLQSLLHDRQAAHLSPRRRLATNGAGADGDYHHYSPSGAASSFSTFLNSTNYQRNPGSVEFAEVENACCTEVVSTELGASLAVEVRTVSAIPAATVPAAEREFRSARIESGCQPERLFRFVPKREADALSASCNIFDTSVDGFDSAVSKHGQLIGRSLVGAFSPQDLERYAEANCVIAGVDALVTRPVVMSEEQFSEWCASLNDSAEAHAALMEHGATCVQVVVSSSSGGGGGRGGAHDTSEFSKIVIFDSRIVLLRVLAVISVVRDSFHCAPGAIAARGCSEHGNRKFEFWCTTSKRLMCGLCLYFRPELRNDCVVIDEAYSTELPRASAFREKVKARQNAVANTLSRLDQMQDTLADRTALLSEQLEDAFVEIRRLVDLQEADTMSVFEMAVKSNAEELHGAGETFRRYESNAAAFVSDVDAALAMREPARVLGVAQAAESSQDGATLDIGAEQEHARSYELPHLKFDKHEILAALRKCIALVGGTLERSTGRNDKDSADDDDDEKPDRESQNG